jgi:hypothetical protein
MTTIIYLNYGPERPYAEQLLYKNLKIAGAPYKVVEVKMLGISAAINYGIFNSNPDNDVVTLANDIAMPVDWLASMQNASNKITNTGIVGIHTVEGLPPANEYGVHKIDVPFGNVLIKRAVINKIGYYNTDLDPYSVNDADYAQRAILAGFYNYYIPGKAEHIGLDTGTTSEYRQMKDKGLNDNYINSQQWQQYYSKANLYMPYDQEEIIINKKQFFEEL